MNTRTVSFGYCPFPLEMTSGAITISSLPSIKESFKLVEEDAGVDGIWIYAPPNMRYDFNGSTITKPYPNRIFGLPHTHKISHASSDSDDHLIFHLWVMSFFTGLRLTSTQAGYVDSTPIRPHKTFDFFLSEQDLIATLSLAETFWTMHRDVPERAKLIAAIVHALLLSKNPNHLQFETFLMLYSAFDACFALAKSVHQFPKREAPTHAQRILWMCNLFKIPVPDWTEKSIEMGPDIASIRNETVHEALFMGEPVGFALHGVGTNTNLTLEMRALVCRLLVALLGAELADYVISPVNTRQRQHLKIG